MSGNAKAVERSGPDASRLLIQVLPRLTPGRCGVSDHATVLAAALKQDFGIDSAFAVLNSTEPSGLAYPVVYCNPSQLLENCLRLTGGRPGTMVVHLSGYGYSNDGAPTRLAESLETVRQSGKFGIAVYFHETFARFPPWRSAFWYLRRQKRAYRKIIAQSALILTNIEHHGEWLEGESQKLGGVPVDRIPVCSTVGEADGPLPFAPRNPALVVFGLAGTRKFAYRQLAASGRLMRTLGIQEILDVGPERVHPAAVNGVPVKPMGPLPAEQLPLVFSQTQFGLATHEWFCLGKSSVFAAYCAHGMIPVMTRPFPKPADGLREGVHVVTARTAEAMRNSGWELPSRAVWNWYMEHRVRKHAERYANWMGASR